MGFLANIFRDTVNIMVMPTLQYVKWILNLACLSKVKDGFFLILKLGWLMETKVTQLHRTHFIEMIDIKHHFIVLRNLV